MRVSEPLEVAGTVIEEIDFRAMSDEDIAASNTFDNVLGAESHPDDPPTPIAVTTANVRTIPKSIEVHLFWAREPDGRIAAEASTWWRNAEENKHIVEIGINVRPDHRRRGLAKALLPLVTDVAEANGRTLILCHTSDRVPEGEEFARRIGAEAGMATHTNRLLLSDVDTEQIERWIAEGPERAPGYSLLAIDGLYPDDLIESIVDLSHVMNTAPRDDLQFEDFVNSVELTREREHNLFAQGFERWNLCARNDETGELAGYTEVFWSEDEPKTVYQGDTGVRPEHRGHALGKWLKAANIKRILDERPQVDNIRTGNADSNDPMLGINHALGFKPYISQTHWQVKVDRVRDYLTGSSV